MFFMKAELSKLMTEALKAVGVKDPAVSLEYPENPDHGDFSSNAALAYAKALKIAPRALADSLVVELKKALPDFVSSIEVAGAGFINFKVKPEAYAKEVINISKGAGPETAPRKKVLVEYTDPNTFKVFHIGHVMANAIGEAISRLIEAAGAKVVRICYPSDIGLHIAKSIWAIQKNISALPADIAPIREKTAFLGQMYVAGTKAYEEDPAAKTEIDELNQVIYARKDPTVNALFEKGKRWSTEHYELLYKALGTSFDDVMWESDMAPIGKKIVSDNIGKVFEKSEGAIVFKGENFGLHTRVFITANDIPTYEAKEVGLNLNKFAKYPDADLSVIVTANEQNDYFKVLSKVIALIDEKNGPKLKHIGHGIMRFASGKMSSRKGNIVTADELIADIQGAIKAKMADREMTDEELEESSEQIAVAAIKYTVLRSAVGSDIIFDSAKSISTEGDSGPYLQYAAVRANSVIAKSIDYLKEAEVLPKQVSDVERLITRFPDIVERAAAELAPQYVANHLIALASAFNSYYNENQILDQNDPESPYRIALTNAFAQTMTRGLNLLGIKVPKKM